MYYYYKLQSFEQLNYLNFKHNISMFSFNKQCI